MKSIFVILLICSGIIPAFADSIITFDVNTDKLIPGEIIELKGKVPTGMEEKPVGVEIKDSDGNVILIRTITSDASGNFILKFKVPNDVKSGAMDIVTNIEIEGQTFSDTKTVKVEPAPEPAPASQPICGAGTIEKDGKCVVDTTKSVAEKSSKGGGCLIATATYGSELAPQVQQLRELRDNQLLQTASGTSFMQSFNEFYYSFSPTISDWERESPIFKEAVKFTLTPMISSLSILNHVDMDSEAKVLGYGISLIILNVGMYFVAPVIVIHTIRMKL